jgi:hypothetical protein
VGNERKCLKPKDGFKDCPDCPEMVEIPAGSFTMGSPANEPQRSNDETRTAPVGLRFTPSLKEALVELAKADRRTLASYIELVLEAHVDARRQEGKKPKNDAKAKEATDSAYAFIANPPYANSSPIGSIAQRRGNMAVQEMGEIQAAARTLGLEAARLLFRRAGDYVDKARACRLLRWPTRNPQSERHWPLAMLHVLLADDNILHTADGE